MNLTTIKTTLVTNKWLIVAIGVLFLIVSVWYITNQIASYEKDLAIAELKEKALNEKETILKKSQDDFFASLKASQKRNEQIASKQAQIEKDKNKINEESKKQIQNVLEKKNIENILKDVKNLLELTGEETENGRISFTKEDTQLIVALKLDYQRLDSELKATQNQLFLEKEKSTALTAELNNAVKSIESSNQLLEEYKSVLEAYKKAAKKTKWAVAKDYIKQGVQIGITALVVSQVSK